MSIPTPPPVRYAGLARAAAALNERPHDDQAAARFAALLRVVERLRDGGEDLVEELCIHVIAPPLTVELVRQHHHPHAPTQKHAEIARLLEEEMPGFAVCEVSWYKAALFDDPGYFVPPVAEIVRDLLRDCPVLTEPLVDRLLDAWATANPSCYPLAPPRQSAFGAFLLRHVGQPVCAASW